MLVIEWRCTPCKRVKIKQTRRYMKTYKLKSALRRGSMLVAALVVAGATILPVTSVSADELNPLTDRSLTLTSGSPGWAFTDGSGNSTYAPPNSGANGQKTGNTFAFKVSSDSTTRVIKGITFQYCTESAGLCHGPGDIVHSGSVRPTNADSVASKTSDLEVVVSGSTQADFATYVNPVSGEVTSVPAPATAGSNFLVYYFDPTIGTEGEWAPSTGWTMTAEKVQDDTIESGKNTDKNNQIKLSNTAGGLDIAAGTPVKIVFFGTDSNYITNPGSDEFFVKINTFDSDTTFTLGDGGTRIDGGVTVANVMNESIQITTKVLETMDFSVGTVDPFTLEALADAGGGEHETSELFAATARAKHNPCEPIRRGMTPAQATNVLELGNADAEFSLSTTETYSTHSYWRLSSNSSAGATVYYSGVTLSNTVNDKIQPIYGQNPNDGLKGSPSVGMEQFGLALANDNDGVNYEVNYDVERDGAGPLEELENAADNTTNGIHASVLDAGISNLSANGSYHKPRLAPLLPATDYNEGAGVVDQSYGSVNTKFAFSETSNTIPVPIASNGDQVVDCVTGKMRYIANIASTTPAGIYTTKINYIAAPQY